jgi:hypothetical protein
MRVGKTCRSYPVDVLGEHHADAVCVTWHA